MKKYLIAASALSLIAACAQSEPEAHEEASDAEVGSTLTDKDEIGIEDVPEAVLAAAKAARPDIDFTEAEKELRNGVTYYDVGGTNEAGEEIELDIMQDDDGWTVVEIQRDIEFDDLPDNVRETLLAAVPGIEPDRIIESDQTDGVIVYEVFVRDENGEETKYEVKLENGETELLAEEWAH